MKSDPDAHEAAGWSPQTRTTLSLSANHDLSRYRPGPSIDTTTLNSSFGECKGSDPGVKIAGWASPYDSLASSPMDNCSPFQNTAGTSFGAENVFSHPEGLLTARNLVRLLLVNKMEVNHPRELQGSQQALPNSFHVSRPTGFNQTMPDTLKQVLAFNDSQAKPRKRKSDVQHEPTKKPRLGRSVKTRRPPKPKPERKELAKYKLDQDIWMRILEFSPPQFLGKARLICKEFKTMVDQFTSIYVNCRKLNYGKNMPPPPLDLTERQYTNLLGSKGCLEPGCPDKNASRTHWSWAKRWCANCWRSKIEREDRLIKNRADQFGSRTTFTQLLECIPVGMHDSFMKPHDYVDVDDNRPRGAPRLYKYYLTEDVDKIIQRYEALTPAPYRQDPGKTAEENAVAFTHYQEEMANLDDKRTSFLATEKAKIDEHMALVQKIEAGVRERRESLRTPYDRNRSARKELFTRRAREDLPHIPEEFVKNATAFKAATRVFRDGGTERGWQTLKPKIEKEWASKGKTEQSNTSKANTPQVDGSVDDQPSPDGESLDATDYDVMHMDIDRCHTRTPHNNIAVFGRIEREAYIHSYGLAQMPSKTPALPPASSLQLDGAANNDASYNGMLMDMNSSQMGHIQTNINGGQRAQREARLDWRSNTRWPYPMRALPPPSFIASAAASMNHNNTSHVGPSSLKLGPILPGREPSSQVSTGSSHISISSLIHHFDHEV